MLAIGCQHPAKCQGFRMSMSEQPGHKPTQETQSKGLVNVYLQVRGSGPGKFLQW